MKHDFERLFFVLFSSTLALPVVKAGGFFAIPFVKGSNDKETVPLFVVTDSINSFALQVRFVLCVIDSFRLNI
jgi:hypothetical protein